MLEELGISKMCYFTDKTSFLSAPFPLFAFVVSEGTDPWEWGVGAGGRGTPEMGLQAPAF